MSGFPSTFPTFYYEENGEIKGVIGTSQEHRAVVIGPLWCPGRPKVLKRLIEVYENFIQQAGVSIYFAHVPDPKWGKALVKHCGAQQIKPEWYRKDL